MTKKKSPVHLIFTAVHIALAVVTLIPVASASKPCLLGYEALCSFSPISTVGLLALACLHIYLHRRLAVKETAV